jgi:hypothetical protein
MLVDDRLGIWFRGYFGYSPRYLGSVPNCRADCQRYWFPGRGRYHCPRQPGAWINPTAASVWTVAAVGLTVGGGLYAAAFIATGISLILLAVLRPLERRLDRRWRKQGVTAVYDPKAVPMDELLTALRNADLHVLELKIDKTVDGGSNQIEITLEERGEAALHGALQVLTGISECNV